MDLERRATMVQFSKLKYLDLDGIPFTGFSSEFSSKDIINTQIGSCMESVSSMEELFWRIKCVLNYSEDKNVSLEKLISGLIPILLQQQLQQ